MLVYSMSASVDGFIADRASGFGWTVPNEEQFRFHLAQTRELGGFLCGRRLYEAILVWETDPSLRGNELGAVFANVWGSSSVAARRCCRRSSKTSPGCPRVRQRDP